MREEPLYKPNKLLHKDELTYKDELGGEGGVKKPLEFESISPEHVEVAKEICKKHITKRYQVKALKGKPCKKCGGGGNVGMVRGRLQPCLDCVDGNRAFQEWLEYCKGKPDLERIYAEQLGKRIEEETERGYPVDLLEENS